MDLSKEIDFPTAGDSCGDKALHLTSNGAGDKRRSDGGG